MEAIRLHPSPDKSNPYSTSHPAPPSALILDSSLPIPQPLNADELLIKVEATTVIRDALTWPESYREEYKILGNDFAGTVVAVNEGSGKASGRSCYKPEDQVYGMTEAWKAGTWSQYAVVSVEETCLKPESLTWAQAAAVPLSALTAYQALFTKAGIEPPDLNGLPKPRKSEDLPQSGEILVTGPAGAVGIYLVQLAKLAGLHVVAASSSNARNKQFLERLGADQAIEYEDLAKHHRRFQTIIDTVGGNVLKTCWSLVSEMGAIVSIDSASSSFAHEHRELGLTHGSENVKAVFFIVSPSKKDLEQLSIALELGLLEPFVACVMPLADARSAYERTSSTHVGRGKMILTPWLGQAPSMKASD